MSNSETKVFLDFQIDLNADVTPQIDQLVSNATLERAAVLSRLEPDEKTLGLLRKGLHEACDAMINGFLKQADAKLEKEENRALERVARQASHLYDALSDLMEYGHTERKLFAEISTCRTLTTGPNGETLKNLLPEANNPFFHLREIVVDLQVCAERAVNKKPNTDPEWAEFFNTVHQYDDGDSYEAASLREYKARSKAYQTPKDLPLQNFLRSFGATWSQLTGQQFTEGKHYSEIGETASLGVDAAKVILDQIAPDVTRQMIVTALRKTRRF